MIKRLRPRYTTEELAKVYSTPHDSSKWEDHNIRVAESIKFINEQSNDVLIAADLSCGDGRILDGTNAELKLYGDFAPGYQFTGPLEDTVSQLGYVDLFICSETLEHLDDPGDALMRIRDKSRELFISTPVDKFDDDNPEHYWAWDYAGIESLLIVTGWEIVASKRLNLSHYYYDFQLVYCV